MNKVTIQRNPKCSCGHTKCDGCGLCYKEDDLVEVGNAPVGATLTTVYFCFDCARAILLRAARGEKTKLTLDLPFSSGMSVN